jgi:pimeloyl-ACP methyl ester carboxylesterase
VGGGTDNDYYLGQTHKIQGNVVGALENAKVTLYLDDKSEPIASTNVESDGSYELEFTPEVHENIDKNNYALLVANDANKSYRSIVVFYDSNNSDGYSYKDTTISSYTDSVYKIKSSLKFDKNATSMLVKKFMPLYHEGKYDSTASDAYAFAYNGAMDELAEHNEYDDVKTFEALQKLSTLNKEDVDVAKGNEATKYAFVVTKQMGENIVVQEVTFDINTNLSLIEDGTNYSLEKTVVGENEYYDSAGHYTFIVENDSILKSVQIDTFDSNKSKTKIRKLTELVKLENDSKTFIIDNLRISDKDIGDENSSKLMKTYTPVKIHAYAHKLYDVLPWEINELWEYLGTQYISSMNATINFKGLFDIHDKYKDRHRAVMVRYVDDQNTWFYTRYYFNDHDNVYKNATVASRVIGETSYHVDGSFDNGFGNIYEKSTTGEVFHLTPSHTIMDFDKIVTKDFAGERTKKWQNSNYARKKAQGHVNNEYRDTRKPLLLIHGWQAVKFWAERNPAILKDYEHNEFEYWHNFISYYLTTPALNEKYKLYTYHYASYKHITFNGRILKDLFSELKNSADTVIGKALNHQNSLTIIAHSMGGLVARSMIEEHKSLGWNAGYLAKLITLDTPHHGSHGANMVHGSSAFAHWFQAKDLKTAGSIDLLWDNYDKYYSPYKRKTKSLYDETIDINEPLSRFAILGDRARFDKHYYQKLDTLGNTDGVHDIINPYLAYLNRNFTKNWSSIVNSKAKNKYLFYVAHSSSKQTYGNKISNPINTSYVYRTTTWTFNGYGYGSGGAEPVCSAFLSWEDKIQENPITRFNGRFTTPSKFIKIDNNGDPQNDNIAYRYFWDYDHQSIMAGRAHNNYAWDEFIDDTSTLTYVNDCSYSSYNNGYADWIDDNNPEDADYSLECKTQHYNYYNYASHFLANGTNNVLDQNTIRWELSNPLRTEPVFMVLHRDLLDIWKGK